MSNEPSQKQIIFVEKIANACNIELPKEFTGYAYWKFINDNQFKYNIAKAAMLDDDDYMMLPDEGYFC